MTFMTTLLILTTFATEFQLERLAPILNPMPAGLNIQECPLSSEFCPKNLTTRYFVTIYNKSEVFTHYV